MLLQMMAWQSLLQLDGKDIGRWKIRLEDKREIGAAAAARQPFHKKQESQYAAGS